RGGFSPERLIREKRTFDAIFVVALIEHLYDDWLYDVLAQIRRLAAPCALVVITTPNEEVLVRGQLMCQHCCYVFHRWQHVRSWSRDSLAAFLESKCLEARRVFVTDFSLTYARRPDPLRTFVKRMKYRFGLRTRGPHLVAIAKVPST